MSPRTRLVIALASTGLVFYLAVGSVLSRVKGDDSFGQIALFNEVVRLVIDSYVEPVDLDRTLDGAVRGLGDALDGESAWLDDATFRAWTSGKLGGAGDVGLTLTRRFAFLMVVAPAPGSPAERAGLRPGDVLKTIDGRHTRTLTAPAGLIALRGAPGSVVKLQVLRSGAADPLEFSLVRERPAAAAVRSHQPAPGTAVVRVEEFGERTAAELRAELEGLQRAGTKAVVLDLRQVARGPVDQGAAVARLFVREGLVAKVLGRKGSVQDVAADPAQLAWSGPLAVLTGRGTAGAAEVVAAAVLDAGRGSVVGESTFGLAAVQRPFAMPEGGLILTVARYASPKGTAIHLKGVKPDVEVDPGEPQPGEDPVLNRALEVLAAAGQKKAA